MKKTIAIIVLLFIGTTIAYANSSWGDMCPEHQTEDTSCTHTEVHSKYDCNVCKKDVTETWLCAYNHSFLVDKRISHYMNLESVVDTETCPYCGVRTKYVENWRCDGGKLYPKEIIVSHGCSR